MPPLRRTFPAIVLSCGSGLLLAACVMPSERSSDLRVVVSNAPSVMRVLDKTLLAATLQDASGAVIPGAALRFVSVNTQVALADSTGAVKAVAPGAATVQVSSAAFASAQPANVLIRVVPLLAIDSVRPKIVKFGQFLAVYGVGLNSITGVTVGGVNAPVRSFTAINTARPELNGALTIWVAPPAPIASDVEVENGFTAATGTDTVAVGQDDRYEPNDTVTSALGTVADSFYNPGLAFEERGDIPRVAVNAATMEWYTFTTTTAGDMTVVITAPSGLFVAEAMVADSMETGLYRHSYSGPAIAATIVPSTNLRAVTPMLETCGTSGYALLFMSGYGQFHLPTDSLVIPLRALPAGKHHLLILYGRPFFGSDDMTGSGAPAIGWLALPEQVTYSNYSFSPLVGYRLLIAPGYRTLLAPDQFEPNGHCGLAKTVTPPFSYTSLTMDGRGRNDWYKFSVATAATYTFTLNGSVAASDLDLQLYQSFLPDSVHWVDGSYSATSSEQITDVLSAGSHFLVVSDWAGVPTPYSLGSTTAAPIARVSARAPVPPQKLNALRERIRTVVRPAGGRR